MSRLRVLLVAIVVALGACATVARDQQAAAIVCENPRPQICTMDYRPVCARLDDGTTGTFANGCSACADVAVISWIENACPE